MHKSSKAFYFMITIAIAIVIYAIDSGYFKFYKKSSSGFEIPRPALFSTELNTIKMEGVTFRLPRNMWLKPYANHSTVYPDETIRGTFDINVLWPSWQGATKENYFSQKNTLKNSFQYIGQESKLININVWRACQLEYPNCDAKKSFEIHYDIYSGTKARNKGRQTSKIIYRNEEPKRKFPKAPNIEFIGFKEAGNLEDLTSQMNTRYSSYIYKNAEAGEIKEFIRCSTLTNYPNPGCHIRFLWKKKFLIEIKFRLPLLKEWQSIKRKTISYLESIIVTESN